MRRQRLGIETTCGQDTVPWLEDEVEPAPTSTFSSRRIDRGKICPWLMGVALGIGCPYVR